MTAVIMTENIGSQSISRDPHFPFLGDRGWTEG